MSDAAKRAAARKAKILARGNTGLQKLAQTARGEEADALYGDGRYLCFEDRRQVDVPSRIQTDITCLRGEFWIYFHFRPFRPCFGRCGFTEPIMGFLSPSISGSARLNARTTEDAS